MSLAGTLNSLSAKVDQIETQYRAANISNFAEFTTIIAQIGPIFKQAEILQHFLEGGDLSNYYDAELLTKEFPDIIIPNVHELEKSKIQAQNFCQRVLPLSIEINSHGYQHSKINDPTLFKRFKAQLLKMLLEELKTPEAELQGLPSQKRIVTDYLRKVEPANAAPGPEDDATSLKQKLRN